MKIIWKTMIGVLMLCTTKYSYGRHFPLSTEFSRAIQQKPTSTDKTFSQPNLDGVVEVSFTVDGKGKIQILSINSTSPQLADYVIKKLEKVKLEQSSSSVGKIVKYSFVFKKQT